MLHPVTGEHGETQIIFLHRILPRKTDQSYGIHVAAGGVAAGGGGAGVEFSPAWRCITAGGRCGGERAGACRLRGSSRRAGRWGCSRSMRIRRSMPCEMKLESMSPMQAFDELKAQDAAKATN